MSCCYFPSVLGFRVLMYVHHIALPPVPLHEHPCFVSQPLQVQNECLSHWCKTQRSITLEKTERLLLHVKDEVNVRGGGRINSFGWQITLPKSGPQYVRCSIHIFITIRRNDASFMGYLWCLDLTHARCPVVSWSDLGLFDSQPNSLLLYLYEGFVIVRPCTFD